MVTTRLALVSLVGVLASGCGSGTEPTPVPLSESASTAHYAFHYSAGDGVDAAWQEHYHAWIVQTLDVSTDRTVTYNKYLSRAHMEALTGQGSSNAYANRSTWTIDTLWRMDNHEIVHLLSSTFGDPTDMFEEGFAVAHQVNPMASDFVPRWGALSVNDRARGYRASGQLPSIPAMATTIGFRSISNSDMSYAVAGSFVRYVLDRFGLDAVKAFFRRGAPNDSLATIRTACLETFGVSLEQIEADWIAALDAGR